MNVANHMTMDRDCRRMASPHPLVENSSTIAEFCHRHNIGRTTYFAWQKAGLGPREIRVGRVVRIGNEAEREWIELRQSP